MTEETLFRVKTADGEEIAIWKVQSEASDPEKNIFLTHGTFSNKKIVSGIGAYFAEQGYISWIMEWRGHGSSPSPEKPFNLETLARYDFPAAFDFLLQEQGVERFHCITHSGGGIILTMFLIHHPEYLPHLRGMALFCCQSFGAATSWKNRFKIWMTKYLSALLGYTPARRFGLGDHNESYTFMRQWCDWNLSGRFIGTDGFDYLAAMPSVNIPVLALAGEGDRFIAPKEGCEAFLHGFQGSANELLVCGKDSGFKENYSHSRLIYSSSAREEIWPRVLAWISNQ